MACRRGTSRVVIGLLVVILVLSVSTASFGLMLLQPKSNGNTGTHQSASNIVVTSLSGLNGLSSPSQASGSTADSITVSGTGQANYSPNEALVSVSVVTAGANAIGATSENAVTTAKVIKALNSVGIDNNSIQTQGYYLYPNYANNYGNNVPPAITGFSVTNSLTVNITSDSVDQLGTKAGQAIDASVAAGANQINLQFAATSSLSNHVNDLALQAAISSGTSQARIIARSLGVNITGVISAVEGYNYSPYYSQGPYFGASLVTLAASTPIIPGTQSNSVSVTIVFAIS